MKQVPIKLMAATAILLLSGCSLNSNQALPSPAQIQYSHQLRVWSDQQDQRRAAQYAEKKDQDYYRSLDREIQLEIIRQEEETKRVAIRKSSPAAKPVQQAGKEDQSKLREKCFNGFNCQSGDCEYPPDDLCRSLFVTGASDGETQPESNMGVTLNFTGSTVENFFFNSAGSTGSDRSHRSRTRMPRTNINREATYSPPAPPKSAHEVWGGVISGAWKDTLGFGQAVAPWFFGADVLKTAFTAPNSYVSVGDDLTSGGENNTSRGDYVSKPVVLVPEVE